MTSHCLSSVYSEGDKEKTLSYGETLTSSHVLGRCAKCEMSSKLSHKVDKSILNKFWQLAECNQTKIIQASKGLIEDLSLRQVDEVRYIHVQLMVKF